MAPDARDADPTGLDAFGADSLPGRLAIRALEAGPGRTVLALDVEPWHLAPNGYLHGGTVVALADTACGYGCRASLPEGATGFTTIELKANYLGTATEGEVRCEARLVHGGRTTQVWDAEVQAGGRTIALVRVTQLVLRPR